jgi:DNA-binding GntR family transcriptional regulator
MADTLYQQIADDLRAQIASGKLKPGCGSAGERPGTPSATPSGSC